jgi:hypothetical protein
VFCCWFCNFVVTLGKEFSVKISKLIYEIPSPHTICLVFLVTLKSLCLTQMIDHPVSLSYVSNFPFCLNGALFILKTFKP